MSRTIVVLCWLFVATVLCGPAEWPSRRVRRQNPNPRHSPFTNTRWGGAPDCLPKWEMEGNCDEGEYMRCGIHRNGDAETCCLCDPIIHPNTYTVAPVRTAAPEASITHICSVPPNQYGPWNVANWTKVYLDYCLPPAQVKRLGGCRPTEQLGCNDPPNPDDRCCICACRAEQIGDGPGTFHFDTPTPPNATIPYRGGDWSSMRRVMSSARHRRAARKAANGARDKSVVRR